VGSVLVTTLAYIEDCDGSEDGRMVGCTSTACDAAQGRFIDMLQRLQDQYTLELVPIVAQRKAVRHKNYSLALSAPAYCMNQFFYRLQSMILPRVVP